MRLLPLPYSLALRLREGGMDSALICEYVGVEPESLEGVLRLAETKLAALIDLSAEPAGDETGPGVDTV